MPPKANPAKLNPLQLRTLTLLQAIAHIPDASKPTPDGDTAITAFPHAHGDPEARDLREHRHQQHVARARPERQPLPAAPGGNLTSMTSAWVRPSGPVKNRVM